MIGISQLKAVNDTETAYSVLIRNHKYAGMSVFPPFESNVGPKQSGTFWKYLQNNNAFSQFGDIRRAERGKAKEVAWTPTTDTFTTSERAARTPIRDITEMYADAPVKPSRHATDAVVNEILLAHEIEVAAICTATATITQNVTLAGATQFNDFTNSDPLDVFGDARLALSYVPYNAGMPNAKLIAVMPPEVFEILRQHPDLKDRIFRNTDGMMNSAQLAEIMGVNQVIVAEAWKQTNDPSDGTFTKSRVWNKDIFIAYVDPTKAQDVMTFGYTVYSRMPGTQAAGAALGPEYGAGTPMRIRDYREESEGGGTTYREADCAWDLKVVSAEFAYLIKNAVA